MANPSRLRNLILTLGAATAVLAIAFVLIVVATQPSQAQTFKVLHIFTGGQDGANPEAGVTLDKAGNLYGTAYVGGSGAGTVYKLTHKGSGWIFNPLYAFHGSDGAYPIARVIFGPNGTLYGTTSEGDGYGAVFNLRPSPSACKSALCPWTETVLQAFDNQAGSAGALPGNGDLIFNQAGNIYGTTVYEEGPNYGYGVVYELMPKSGGGYTESPVYVFSQSDGTYPYNGVIFDNAGNLYGTTTGRGGYWGYGNVFQLVPANGGWTENVLYSFQGGNDGSYPYAGLILDQSGNLYGATSNGGTGIGGTVFKLTPSGDGWTYSLIYSFTGYNNCGPYGTLAMDGSGNLYGTTPCGGANHTGSVFKLTPSGNSWTYTSLHDFTGGSDGGNPYCNVAIDANGNLYGTAFYGGTGNCVAGCGVVWEITP